MRPDEHKKKKNDLYKKKHNLAVKNKTASSEVSNQSPKNEKEVPLSAKQPVSDFLNSFCHLAEESQQSVATALNDEMVTRPNLCCK